MKEAIVQAWSNFFGGRATIQEWARLAIVLAVTMLILIFAINYKKRR